MSVLVKGMEMPSSCNNCLFGHWSSLYHAVFCELLNFKDYPADFNEYKTKVLDNCTLVEINEDVIKQAVCSKLGINGREYLLPAEKAVLDAVTEAISSN